MTYCLDDEFLKNLLEIREEYSKIKQIDFAKAPQPYAISCFLAPPMSVPVTSRPDSF